MAGFEELLSGLFGGFTGGAGIKKGIEGLEGQKSDISDLLYGKGQTAPSTPLFDLINQKTTFQPYSITSGLGSFGLGPDGNSTLGLSDQQKAIQDQMFEQGQGLLGRAAQDPMAREKEVYDRIRSTQMPEEQRQQSSMQANLFSSGRGGMTSNAFGGSPEQFAFEKARAEAMNQASLGAMQQTQSELMNQYQMGQGMLQQGYTPMQQLFQQAGLGMNQAQLQQGYDLQGAGLLSQLGLGGLTANINLQNIVGGLYGQGALAAGEGAKGIGQFLGSLIPGNTPTVP